MSDKLLLRKRFIIGMINDQLKNPLQIEHSRPRSPIHFVVNVLAGLIAYRHHPGKPAINWSAQQAQALKHSSTRWVAIAIQNSGQLLRHANRHRHAACCTCLC
jgi:hypothetical protein